MMHKKHVCRQGDVPRSYPALSADVTHTETYDRLSMVLSHDTKLYSSCKLVTFFDLLYPLVSV